MKLLGAGVAAIFLAGIALAQVGAPPGGGYIRPPEPKTDQHAIDQLKQAERVKAAQPTKADILRDAAALMRAMNLPCAVSDAALLGDGNATINGKTVHVKSYETACSDGLGYFLVDQAPEAPIGFTCFGAEATHNADIAAKREPQPLCALPANTDTKRAAAAVLSGLGQQCAVTGLKVIGIDTKANTELTEVACSGGTGFMISSPRPGNAQKVSALSCPDSYRKGLACRLSSNGAPMVTVETFKQALAQHKVACTVQDTKVIGKQNVSKRHVIEFKCPEQPNGLVAYIPLEDSTAPFEVMNCPEAGQKAHIICSLTKVQ